MSSKRKTKLENDVVVSRPSLFGSPLKDTLEVACYFIEQCIDYLLETGLEEIGLFRLCGSQTEIQQLKEMVLEDPLNFIFEGDVIHSVTGLLKMYFREMPDPLMRMELYDMWMTAAAIPEEEDGEQQRISTIASVLKLFKPEYKYILGKLCYFLKKVHEHRAVNQMDSRNLALCFGPNLLHSPTNIDISRVVQDSERVSTLVKILIENAEFFFGDIEALNPFQKVFGIIFPDGEKKIPIRNNSTLRPLVEKIASYHHIDMNHHDPLDINGNIVSLDTPLRRIRGLQVEILKKGSRVTVNWEHGTTRLAFPPGKNVSSILDHLSMTHQIDPLEYRVLDINGRALLHSTPIEDIAGSTIQVRRSDEIVMRTSKSTNSFRPSRRDILASPGSQKTSRQSHIMTSSNLASSAVPTPPTLSLPAVPLSVSNDSKSINTPKIVFQSPSSLSALPNLNSEKTKNQILEKPELPDFQKKKSGRTLFAEEESSWQSSLPLSPKPNPSRTSVRIRIAERTDSPEKIEYRGFSGIHPVSEENSNSAESTKKKTGKETVETPRKLETPRLLESLMENPSEGSQVNIPEQPEKYETPEFRRSTVRPDNMSKRPDSMFIGARSPRVSCDDSHSTTPKHKISSLISPAGKTPETGNSRPESPESLSSRVPIPDFDLDKLTRSMEHLDNSRETSKELEFHSNFFTFHLPYDGILEPTELLQNMIEVICKARGAHVKDFEAEDKFGNLVGFETQLEKVVGGEIMLKRKAV